MNQNTLTEKELTEQATEAGKEYASKYGQIAGGHVTATCVFADGYIAGYSASHPPSPAKAEQPFNRDENSIEGKAAIEFYEWLQRSSMAKAEVPINIKWRMFVDQKNVKQKNNQ